MLKLLCCCCHHNVTQSRILVHALSLCHHVAICAGVATAGAKLPFSCSANEMLRRFGGPVLIAQGVLDPLNDAKKRAELFKTIYDNLEVEEIQAGD